MKIKNKGLSYYELLIVVTIMGLMAAFITISLGTVYRNNVNRTADNIESSVKAARNNALSKGNKYGFVNFYYKDNKLYVNVGQLITSYDGLNQDWKQIGTSVDHVGVRYNNGAGDSYHNCYDGTLFNFSFKQSTGECFGFMLPYSSLDTFPSDAEIDVENGKSEATVAIGQYGNIEVK